MDQVSKPVSGIPRLSRLPVPSILAKESYTTSRKSGTALNVLDTSQKGRPVAGAVGTSAGALFTSDRHGNKALKSESELPSKLRSSVPESSGDVLAPSEEYLNRDITSSAVAEILTDPCDPQPATPREKRKPRPSLSDRTVETLSQIPPSPSSNRRKSGFFNAELSSPTTRMLPPLRPASAMSTSRSRPSSPFKRPAMPPLPTSSATKPDSRAIFSRSSMAQPAAAPPEKSSNKKVGLARGSASLAAKPVLDRPSSKSVSAFNRTSLAKERPSSAAPIPNRPPAKQRPPTAQLSRYSPAPRKAPSISATTSSSLHQSQRPSTDSSYSTSTVVEDIAGAPSTNISKSSAALRSAIAKAKQEVAKREAQSGQKHQPKDPFAPAGLGIRAIDCPSDMEELGDSLRKRIKTALLTGHLNMAALDLKSIPSEIQTMYDKSENIGVDWSECVDLTKFIAADNQLERLEDDIFPDATNGELEEAEDGDCNGLLRGLETLDLHSNLLKNIPIGIRRLQNLRSLNLAGNKLGPHDFEIVCQLGDCLTELKISGNELSGGLSEQIKNLRGLQTLHLHGNKLDALPEELQGLVNLRVLDLAHNNLSSHSFAILTNMTLVELVISSNRLSGILFPSQNGPILKSLKLLDISQNAIDALADGEIALPSIQTMKLNGNRLKTLPDMSSWEELLTFTVAENLISHIPSGLVALRKLRNADCSNNNITKIDEGIAFMENLVSINLAGNPLRERKYLGMATDDLKADLQKRGTSLDEHVGAGTKHPISDSSSGGILDWSSRSLSSLETPLPQSDGPTFEVRLHHNALNAIPLSLFSDSISATLRTLDISHNPFASSYLGSSLSLPRLKELCLASCCLKSLDDLVFNLSAPQLTTLNLSANHLSGTLPRLRVHFPSLTTVLAADNHFSALEVSAVQGLSTLDIRNNEIDHLEPKLGLLGGEAGLRCLEVSGNKFRVPRWDILQRGTEAVLGYLRGRVPAHELEGEETGVTPRCSAVRGQHLSGASP